MARNSKTAASRYGDAPAPYPQKSLEHEAEVHHNFLPNPPWHFSALTTQATGSSS